MDKLCCPACGTWQSRVINSRPGTTDTDADGRVSRYMRWRLCVGCHVLFETKEELTGNVQRPEPVDRGDRSPSA